MMNIAGVSGVAVLWTVFENTGLRLALKFVSSVQHVPYASA
jgi:hypothetical protein